MDTHSLNTIHLKLLIVILSVDNSSMPNVYLRSCDSRSVAVREATMLIFMKFIFRPGLIIFTQNNFRNMLILHHYPVKVISYIGEIFFLTELHYKTYFPGENLENNGKWFQNTRHSKNIAL